MATVRRPDGLENPAAMDDRPRSHLATAKIVDTIPSLDGFRAISIILVVLSHCGLEKYFPGRFGVTIFFFLSGYLMTSLLMVEYRSTKRINLAHFYARRAFRLMPPLVVALLVTYLLVWLELLPGRIILAGVIAQLFYFANYYMLFAEAAVHLPLGTGLLWSLSVEEHFYLVYPVLLLVLLPRCGSVRQVAVVLAAICLCVLLWRLYLISLPGTVEHRIAFATDTRIDSILFGCCLALLYDPRSLSLNSRPMGVSHWVLLLCALVVLASTFVIRNYEYRETYRYTIQGTALAPIFVLAVRFADQWPFRILNSQALTKIGIWSYAIYLIHEVAMWTIVTSWPSLNGRPLFLVPLVSVVAIAFAIAIDRLVDPYFRRLRSRFRPASLPTSHP